MALENVIIGNYKVIQKLFTRDIAEYYLVTPINPEKNEPRYFLIKRLIPSLRDIEEFQRMLKAEDEFGQKVQHKNIVRAYSLERQNDIDYLVMEFVHGQDLKTIVEQGKQLRKPIPIDLSLKIITTCCFICDTLYQMIDANRQPLKIIHRNISPENIVVAYSGEIKLDDLSLATIESGANPPLKIPYGNLYYVAPEQLDNKPASHQGDVFSLGVILWELVTGKKPFSSDNQMEAMEKIKSGRLESPKKINPNIPDQLEKLLMKCVAPQRHDRYASAKVMGDALNEFLGQIKSQASAKDIANYLRILFQNPERRLELRQHIAAGGGLSAEKSSASPGENIKLSIKKMGVDDIDSFIQKNKQLSELEMDEEEIVSEVTAITTLEAPTPPYLTAEKRRDTKIGIFDSTDLFYNGYLPEVPRPSLASKTASNSLKDKDVALLITGGPKKGAKYPLGPEKVTIGRVNANTISISDPETSRRHAEIYWEDGKYILADCGSYNGCYVNGEKVDKVILQENDEILIGQTAIKVVIEGVRSRPANPLPPSPEDARQ